jgi:peroxiredoxin Q/BCP
MFLLINLKNKKMNNNKKSSIVSIVIVLVAVLALGYFLFKTSPQNPEQNQNTIDADSMHEESSMAVNNEAMNSLIGKPIPEIQLSNKDGKVYTAVDFKGKNTVLFFNEGLMCYPACWNQMAAFGSDARFNSDQIQTISIVVDSASDWQKAIDKMPELAKVVTMFDVNAKASQQLGILTTASSMHTGSLPGHTYIVIDKDGIVRYVFDDPNMAIGNEMLFGKIGELK